MNKKTKMKKAAALFLGIALAVGSVGCGNFIEIDNERDLAQTVASVDITDALQNDPKYASVAGELKKVVSKLSTDISKRDLVAYFLSTGYSYVESYGYEETFNMLMDSLVSREIMIQYALAHYLKTNTTLSASGLETYIANETAAAAAEEDGARKKELLENHPEVLTLKYFLTENGAYPEEFDRAEYNLKKSFNTSLDSLEENYIKTEEEEHDHEEARTLPTDVKTEKEKYYDTTKEYDVYTGRNLLTSCGSYEKVEGGTSSSRQKAYNAFLANLEGYNMIGDGEEKWEDTSDVTLINYYYVELSSILGQSLINKYFEDLEDEVAASLSEDYVNAKYDEIYNEQYEKYATPSEFSTAMDSVSDTSFLLYGKENFGYVYNILIPFSKSQEVEYTTIQNNKTYTTNQKYIERAKILKNVVAKDQRGSWISEHDHANYSYEKDGDYYFFEGQGLYFNENSKYETLEHYAGNYYYRGTVAKDAEGALKATPTEVSIDDLLSDMESYITSTVDDANVTASGTAKANYFNITNYVKADKKDEVDDYSKFIYYEGKVSGLPTDNQELANAYFDKTSTVYKTISAVNEVTFAYSTDPGSLNTYLGYAVTPYKTNFVDEFAYAAQYVIEKGVGNYVVCATDYGWHIIFASFVYDRTGEKNDATKASHVYGGYTHADKDKEGTFSNLFFESLKTSAAKNYTTEKQNTVLKSYNNDASVTLYKDRYEDLLKLDNN